MPKIEGADSGTAWGMTKIEGADSVVDMQLLVFGGTGCRRWLNWEPEVGDKPLQHHTQGVEPCQHLWGWYPSAFDPKDGREEIFETQPR